MEEGIFSIVGIVVGSLLTYVLTVVSQRGASRAAEIQKVRELFTRAATGIGVIQMSGPCSRNAATPGAERPSGRICPAASDRGQP
jgi:hypothetical protein